MSYLGLVVVSIKMVKHFCVSPTVEPLDGFITKSPILFNFTTLLTKSGKRALDKPWRNGGIFMMRSRCDVMLWWFVMLTYIMSLCCVLLAAILFSTRLYNPMLEFRCFMFTLFLNRVDLYFTSFLGDIFRVWPLPSNSDHRDYSICSRESL